MSSMPFCLARLSVQLPSLVLGVMLLAPSWAGAEIHTVGSGLGCDFDNLPDAISAASSGDTLRLADPTVTVPYQILIKNLTIRGGYASTCDGSDDPSPVTVVKPSAGSRLFGVIAATVGLQRLELRDADTNLDGGIVYVTGESSSVVAIDVAFKSNDAENGGAVLVLNGGSFVSFDSVFSGNSSAEDGGAIWCDGGLVQLWGGGADFNVASGDGGVVYGDDCEIGIFSSAISGGTVNFTNNDAANGGVVFALGGSIEVFSYDGERLSMTGNSALGSGGVFDTRGDAVLEVAGARFFANDADVGGVLRSSSSEIALFGVEESVCESVPGPCLVFDSNSAQAGGVLAARHGIHVREAVAIANESTAAGSFYWGESEPEFPGLLLESSVIAEIPNTSQGSAISSRGPLKLRSVTIANNDQLDPLIFQNYLGEELAITQSILWGNAGDLYQHGSGGPDVVEVECNVVQSTATLPAGHIQSVVLDPELESTEAGWPHYLARESVAIDLCSDPAVAPRHDVEHNPRPNGDGFDAGAWEDPSFFRDSFESGDTGAWSAQMG